MYESVTYLTTYISYLGVLVSAGGVFTALMNTLKWITAEDEGTVEKAKKNIKMCVIAVVIALSVGTLVPALMKIIG